MPTHTQSESKYILRHTRDSLIKKNIENENKYTIWIELNWDSPLGNRAQSQSHTHSASTRENYRNSHVSNCRTEVPRLYLDKGL